MKRPRTYCVLDEDQCEIDCVHPADYDALAAERDRLRDAVLWALGEVGEFPEEPELLAGKYKRRFYWRTELRRRAFGAADNEGDATPRESAP